MNNSIAVIIPAYKESYLAQTLDSLANQSDYVFNIYIGDDCSPYNLKAIVDLYRKKLNISYTRFEDNFGVNDLVGQWNRCLDLMENEDWFIMFSDDDIMEPNCIKKLRFYIDNYENDIFHFNLKIIDSNSNILNIPQHYSRVESSITFFDKLYSRQIDARMPEFAFKYTHFKQCGGFVNFESAMCTDNATVIACALERGICTIEGTYVYWRNSGENVSSGRLSIKKHVEFYRALVSFFNWFDFFCAQKGLINPWTRIQKLVYLLNQGLNMRSIIGTNTMLTIFKSYREVPKGLKLIALSLSIILYKLKKKFSYYMS